MPSDRPTLASHLDRARHLLRSDYGRLDGWHVELDGESVGELDDARFEEMFWTSYAVTPSSGARGAAIFDDDLWNECRFNFRNRVTGELVTTSFCGGSPPFVREGRVSIRALYLLPSGLTQRLLLRGLTLLSPRSATGKMLDPLRSGGPRVT